MLEQREKLWDYPVVEPGQVGPTTTVTMSAEHIADYASIAQNPDPRFQRTGISPEYGGALAAMPTMVLSFAPLLRESIAEANGFVAQERSRQARRQTPFAKCEIRWSRPVMAGDTITATRRVLEKYERRGSKFVTFRVEATDQWGHEVAQYDYTCIFEYAQGAKSVPSDPGPARPTVLVPRTDTAARQPPTFLTFDSIAVGDQLATLSISESQEIINRKDAFRPAGGGSRSNIHTDQEFARQNIFGGTVNSGPATMSYVDQMLQRSFPLRAFYDGGRLLMRAIEPIRAGDTVTFHGEMTGKRQNPPSIPPYQGGNEGGLPPYQGGREGGHCPYQGGKKGGVVECRIKGINQRGDLVSLSDAQLVLTD